jgi:hypothetical protein
LVVAWLLFPLVFLAVCLGCGLAVQWLSGRALPGALLPAVGLALIVVVASLTTTRSFTAPITTALVVVFALAGYALSIRQLRRVVLDPWALAVGLGIYALCAAPVVLSGNATFLGYFVDSDPAFHLVLINWLLSHGRDLTGVPSFSYSVVPNVLHQYIGTAYPTGADVALGAVRPLTGQDAAWIFQPYVAVLMSLGAVALDALLVEVVRFRPLRALCAFIAAQAGLAYAFYLQGALKEIATVLLVTLAVTLMVELLRLPFRLRALVPLAIVGVAALDVYSLTIVAWLGIPVAVCAGIAVWRGRHLIRRRLSGRTAAIPIAVVVILLALAAPVISGASRFISVETAVLGQQNALGNLAAPLPKWELFGIWPNGDFRFPALHYRTAYVLIGLALAGSVLGALWIVRRRALGPLLLLVGEGIPTAILLGRSSPYAASKVLMIFSVTVVLTAMLGAVALEDAGRRIEAWLLAAAIATGVVWTNLLAYHDSSVAPQPRFRELASIGARFNGQGPAFYNLWDTFPVYFLRGESVSIPDTFAGPVPLRPGLPPHTAGQPSTPWDPNELDYSFLHGFRLLILGRSPIRSRPPANFRLVYQGRYYDVYQRMPAPVVLRHIPLSYGGADPPSPASCSLISSTAALAGRDHARLAYVIRPSMPTLIPTRVGHPPQWAPDSIGGGPPEWLSMGQSSGLLIGIVRITEPGRYEAWVGGTLSRRVIVMIGGRQIGSVRHQIGTAGQFLKVGTVQLDPGRAFIEILRPPSYYAPGNVVGGELLGPLVLVREGSAPAVGELAPRDARSLCGKPLEWLEIVR